MLYLPMHVTVTGTYAKYDPGRLETKKNAAYMKGALKEQTAEDRVASQILCYGTMGLSHTKA